MAVFQTEITVASGLCHMQNGKPLKVPWHSNPTQPHFSVKTQFLPSLPACVEGLIFSTSLLILTSINEESDEGSPVSPGTGQSPGSRDYTNKLKYPLNIVRDLTRFFLPKCLLKMISDGLKNCNLHHYLDNHVCVSIRSFVRYPSQYFKNVFLTTS